MDVVWKLLVAKPALLTGSKQESAPISFEPAGASHRTEYIQSDLILADCFGRLRDAVEVGQVEWEPDELPLLDGRVFRVEGLDGPPSSLLASCGEIYFGSMASELQGCGIPDTGAVALSAILFPTSSSSRSLAWRRTSPR